jgi:hypothetical protein
VVARAVRTAPADAAALSPTAAMPVRNFRRGKASEAGAGALQHRQPRRG